MGIVNRTRDDNTTRFNAQYYVANTITVVGILVSIVFICVHLVVHSLSNKLHNLRGRNLASFCISLLMEYSCILLSIIIEDYICWLISALVNYFVLSSYMWMLMMSYDTWRTIRHSVQECTLDEGNQWKRFSIYSCSSWCIPIFYLIIFDYVVPKYVPNYRVLVDNIGCPISEPLLTLLKECTLLLILFANFVFFASSLYYIYVNSRSETFSADHNCFMNHFALHVRLILITGLTWTAEELAFFSGIDVLSLAFQAINMFEGLFIAIAFTCRKRVFHSIKVLSCV